MIKLKVYGRLRKFLGKAEFEINAATPRQAFSFLVNSFEGIQEHIEQQEYCIMAGNINITEDLVDLQTTSDIKIINEKKCLTFTPEFFKHFKNMLMSILVNFERFNKNKKFQKLMSEAKDEIKSK